MQADLFSIDEPDERPRTRKGWPIETAIAKRLQPTECVVCNLPITTWIIERHEWLPLLERWVCLSCLTKHYGLTGVLATLQANGYPLSIDALRRTGDG